MTHEYMPGVRSMYRECVSACVSVLHTHTHTHTPGCVNNKWITLITYIHSLHHLIQSMSTCGLHTLCVYEWVQHTNAHTDTHTHKRQHWMKSWWWVTLSLPDSCLVFLSPRASGPAELTVLTSCPFCSYGWLDVFSFKVCVGVCVCVWERERESDNWWCKNKKL